MSGWKFNEMKAEEHLNSWLHESQLLVRGNSASKQTRVAKMRVTVGILVSFFCSFRIAHGFVQGFRNVDPAKDMEDLIDTTDFLQKTFRHKSLQQLFPHHSPIYLRSVFSSADGKTVMGPNGETVMLSNNREATDSKSQTPNLILPNGMVGIIRRGKAEEASIGHDGGMVIVDVACSDSKEKFRGNLEPLEGIVSEVLSGLAESEMITSLDSKIKGSDPKTISSRSSHVLWLHGKGGNLDPWMLESEQLCAHYDLLILEDELLVVAIRDKTEKAEESKYGRMKCKLLPFDSNQVADTSVFHNVPWRPDEILPSELEGLPMVSFHAYKVFEKEAKHNHHRWLVNPDEWTPFLMDLVQQNFLIMCLDKVDCRDDRLPFRLIFTEELGQEFIDCLSQGVIPLYYMSANLASYFERVLLFMPFFFTTPEEMHNLIRSLTDGPGILREGVRMFMTHESNHYLTSLYWGQSKFIRLLSSITAMHNQERSVMFYNNPNNGIPLTGSSTPSSELVISGELLICVHSGRNNRSARDLIRNTWAKGSRYPGVLIRVVFFVGHSKEMEMEQNEKKDLIVLKHYEDAFETIWMKTAALIRFGSRYFRKKKPTGGKIRYLMKCDDDTFFNIDGMVEDLFDMYTGRNKQQQARQIDTNATSEKELIDILGGRDGGFPGAGFKNGIKPTLALQTVDIGQYETSKHIHTGHYWGYIMALVQPNRNETDKYYVPYRAFGNEFYPVYARGMGYALSEDLVIAAGDALESNEKTSISNINSFREVAADGLNPGTGITAVTDVTALQTGRTERALLEVNKDHANTASEFDPSRIKNADGLEKIRIAPFPYREDVSTGLYLYQVSKNRGLKVRPMQRKDHMPLNVHKYCAEDYKKALAGEYNPPTYSDGTEAGGVSTAAIGEAGMDQDLLELHRYGLDNHECLWNIVEKRRKVKFSRFEPKKKFVSQEFHFCECLVK